MSLRGRCLSARSNLLLYGSIPRSGDCFAKNARSDMALGDCFAEERLATTCDYFISSYKSFHSGLRLFINSIFFFREPPLICFSLATLAPHCLPEGRVARFATRAPARSAGEQIEVSNLPLNGINYSMRVTRLDGDCFAANARNDIVYRRTVGNMRQPVPRIGTGCLFFSTYILRISCQEISGSDKLSTDLLLQPI